MKLQLLCMRTWRRVNLLCSVRHAGSEVTFLCARPTDCAGTFSDCKMERQLAVGWPAAIFHLRNSLACQSRQRQPLMPAKAG